MYLYPYTSSMVKRVLVVGINGFVGHHLAHELLDTGLEVVGAGVDTHMSDGIPTDKVSYVSCDFTSPEAVKELPLQDIDAVINLAGLAQVGSSFGKEDLYNKVNVAVHTVLIDRLRELDKHIRIIAVSSGAVYDSDQPMPLTETSKLITSGSPYALSKILLEQELQKYIEQGEDIIIARPFNHTGPGQRPGFILPDLTERILQEGHLTIGPLNTSRDYTDVRDVVKAYRLLATTDKPGQDRIINICSGKSVSRDDLIEHLKTALQMPDLPISTDPSLARPNDPLLIYGDNSKLRSLTGWQPVIPLEQTVQDFVDWVKSQPKD